MRIKLQCFVLLVVLTVGAFPAECAKGEAQSGVEVTIPEETRGRLSLQSELHSKMNEVGDTTTASLIEPIHAEGRLVLPKGTEFRGRITKVKEAKRLQRAGNLSIVFDRVILPWGEEPVSVQVTAIEDWNENEKLRGNSHGKLKAGRQGARTLWNIGRGGTLGTGASLIALLFGGAAGAGARVLSGLGGTSIAAGAVSGLLLTKGREVRTSPGAILRIKFTKPCTITLR